MDDIVIEETMTYVARELGPMYSIKTDPLIDNDDPTVSDFVRNIKNLNTDIIRP
jgi:hypothetical protein